MFTIVNDELSLTLIMLIQKDSILDKTHINLVFNANIE